MNSKSSVNLNAESELKVTVVQMTSIDDAEVNRSAALRLIEQAVKEFSPDLICFPENALYLRLKEGETIPTWSEEDEFFLPFVKLAQERKVHLHFGSLPAVAGKVGAASAGRTGGTGSTFGSADAEFKSLDDKGSNASLFISKEGEIRFTYHKIHLFDIQLDGRAPLRESDVFRHGETPEVLEVNGWKVGQSICYDIRFSELYLQYAKLGVDVILIPAAFLVPTGQAHWHILNRARAIESQAYVLSAAQAGVHESESGRRETFGHSLVVAPWGQVLKEGQSSGEELLHVTLQKSEIEKVRRQIPMAQHRRLKSF